MIYREPDLPTPRDPHLIEPDRGYRNLLVGGATPAQVLATLGDDCKLATYGSGEITAIDYSYDRDRYDPSRAMQHTRPESFSFAFSLCNAITIGPYQKDLYTTGRIGYGATRAAVLDVFGAAYEELRDPEITTLRYAQDGIQFLLGRDGTVTHWVVFRALRR